MMPEGDIKQASKEEMVNFVKSRFARGKDTKLQDLQDNFSQKPWELSEGTIINYLNELVEKRKISTWKTKTNRFYGPPKISLPIKVGVAIAVFIISISILIDMYLPPELISRYVYFGLHTNPHPYSYMLPLVSYLLILDFIYTIIWYVSYKRKKKSI